MANELGALISSEVVRAESDYQNVRTRALSIVAVAGGLVTLISGLLAIAVSPTNQHFLNSDSKWALLVALIAFVGSAICALVVNIPSNVNSPAPSGLQSLVESDWSANDWDKRVAQSMAQYLVSLRAANDNRTIWLISSIALEIMGIAATAAVALFIVQHVG